MWNWSRRDIVFGRSVGGNPDAPVQQFPSHVPALICFVGTEYRLQCHLNFERLSSII